MPEINPTILVWARETAGLSIEEAVRKIGIQDGRNKSAVEKLADLESGRAVPTRRALMKMVKQYRRPLLAFHMSQPPRKEDRGSDFRALTEDRPVQQDALLDALIRDVKARQSMVKSILELDSESRPVSFVGTRSVREGVSALTLALQEAIGFNLQSYRAQPSIDEAFGLLHTRSKKLLGSSSC